LNTETIAGAGMRSMDTAPWPRVCAAIDLSALRHNAAEARRLAGNASLCAVVKADAYGHGCDLVVPELVPLVDAFAVATVGEGVAVRKLNSERPVIILSEFNHPEHIRLFNEYRLQPVVHTQEQVGWLCGQGSAVSGCWLKVDSGMHRLGISPEDLENQLSALNRSGQPIRGLLSHFAAADEVGHALNAAQLERFRGLVQRTRIPSSMANSAALAAAPDSHFDMVRPGLMLYGVSPFAKGERNRVNLRPVMRFSSRIIATRNLAPGAAVGYGATWSSDVRRRIATVSAGYADGYPRCLGNRGFALVHGFRVPVVGRVSMDSLALDVTDSGDVETGDEVELWGDRLDVAEVASLADTIPYELLCRVSPRVPRRADNRVRSHGQITG
jgi:alanine racemase